MGLSARITEWLVSTVTISTPTTVSNYGDPSYGANATLPARVEQTEKLVIDTAGNETRIGWVVVTLSPIALNARVWLPGDNTSDVNAGRRVISIKNATTKNGTVRLYETYFA